MPKIDEIVRSLLKTADRLKLTAFSSYVDGINWEEAASAVDGSTLVQVSPNAEQGVVYPTLYTCVNPVNALIAELGRDFIRRDEARNRQWMYKYDTATATQVQAVQVGLSSGGYATYHALVESFPDPITRLVAIHVSNALLANKIPISDTLGIDLMTHGATSEYCRGRRYHSLVPLWSIYCPASIHDDYGLALAYASDFKSLKSIVSCSAMKETAQLMVTRLAQ